MKWRNVTDTYAEDIREYNILNVHKKFKGNPAAIFVVGHSFWSKKNLKEVLFFCYPFQRFGEELICRVSANNKHWWTKNPCKNIFFVCRALSGWSLEKRRQRVY